jgi:hypothetical protein
MNRFEHLKRFIQFGTPLYFTMHRFDYKYAFDFVKRLWEYFKNNFVVHTLLILRRFVNLKNNQIDLPGFKIWIYYSAWTTFRPFLRKVKISF